ILGILRGTRIARLNIAPFQYNPVTNKIRIYENINFEINFEQANIAQTIELKKKNDSPYFKALSGQFLNYKPLESRDTLTKFPVKYVIISDPVFESQLQAFIEWKIKKGFTVIEAYTDDPNVGNTTTSIKAYLEDLYNAGTSQDPAPSFVLFVGDVAQIPAFTGNAASHISDLYYCEYTGDYFPEIYYGRFSATNAAELQPQIDKTLQYEQYLMPDPSFLNEVVMVAGMDGSHGYNWCNGQINYGTENYFNAAHGLISHTYLYPNSGSQAAEIKQNISDGVAFANYTAHCGASGWSNPAFQTSDIQNLQNQDKYCLMIGNCCSSSAYNNPECFAEAVLRAENKGALGYIGGSNSTWWDEDYYWGVGVGEITENPPPYEETTLGVYDRTFHDHGEPFEDWYITQDQIIFAGNLAVTEGKPNSAEYYWEIYCLMGDPSLMVYFSEPSELTASYASQIPLGTTSLTVITEPYAYVAISMNGTLHSATIADIDGIATVALMPFQETGIADIIITNQNYQPYFGTITVESPSGAYIILNNYQINDSLGNNNDSVDFGEIISLNIELSNIGNSTAFGLSATLSTSDTLIEITDSTQVWGNITAGNASIEPDAFAFIVQEFVPDQHKAFFTLIIQDNTSDNTWTYSLYVTLNAPVLSVCNFIIDDNAGNNNGRLDPGETANIIISSSNNGHCYAPDAIANLTSDNPDITINNSYFELDTIHIDEIKNAVFNVTIDPLATVGTILEIDFAVSSGMYFAEKTFYPMIGIILEDFETGNFEKFDWELTYPNPWLVTDNGPYEGYWCARSGSVSHMGTTEMSISFNVIAQDSISFYRKVSSEQNYDFLKFYIDGVKKDDWSGELEWNKVAFPVSIGNHTFKWVYSKDYSTSHGNDCAWIDYIVFPPVSAIVSVESETYNYNTALTNYPNPFNNNTTISFTLPEKAIISLKIYNSLGNEVFVLSDNNEFDEGIHKLTLNASSLNTGIYYCVLLTNKQKLINKLVIVK
ncbi:MAG: T9SS type A sorting domain-containing protein, partial [Bacteroidales bacterium]|nr:T9SS type A sorting domain-containing protein [Bacteroidales bacterium]